MPAFRLGTRTVDLRAGTICEGSVTTELTPTEVRLLHYLSQRPGEVVPREELLAEVWGYSPSVRSRTIDTTASRLRNKIEDVPAEPRFLHTIYGRGVRLDGVEIVEEEGAALTRFVGRRAAMADLAAAARKGRLTTLLGPAGAGKSRLLAELMPKLGAGAVLVRCLSVRDARDLDLALLEALGAESGADISRLLDQRLLVLDECDVAPGAVAERVSAWLARAGRLRVLAASRCELRIPGEQRRPLGGLEREEATELLLDRTRLRDPSFSPSPEQVEQIEQITASVDRLPLPIEIIASQIPLVGVERLAALLQAPIALGAPLSALAPLVERSLAGLPPEQRAALASASLLEAPFDVDDLAAVSGLQVDEALRALDALVSRSLAEAQGGRHRLYRLVREIVRRDLSPQHPAFERHARWFARLGARDILDRRSEHAVRATLLRASADLRAALGSVSAPRLEIPLSLALLWCCAREGRVLEGLEVVRRLSDRELPASDRVLLANLASPLWSASGDERAALSALEGVLPLLSSPEERVGTWCAIAALRGRRGDAEGAQAALRAASPGAEKARNYAQLLATAAYHSPRPLDEERMREALAAARSSRNILVEIECLGMLATAAYTRHADWAEGRRGFQRLLERCGSDGAMARHRVRAFMGLGLLEREVGHLDAAEGHLEQAETLALRSGLSDLADQARVLLARVWNQSGRTEDALSLVEPLAAEERPPPHRPSARALLVLAEIRERLGERSAAIRLLTRVLQHERAAKADFAAEALDLLALLEGDERRLALAAAEDDRPAAGARRRVFASLIARKRGEETRADTLRAEAEEEIARLGLGPASDAALWLARGG